MRLSVALLAGLLLCSALPSRVRAQFPTELPEPDATGNYVIPGFGSIPQGASLDEDFDLPDGVTHPPDDNEVLESGTTIEDLDFGVLEQMWNDHPAELQGLISEFLPGPPQTIPPDASYTIIVQAIDSTRFPEITVEFKAFPKDAATPPFDPAFQTAAVMETVMAGTNPGPKPALPPDGFSSVQLERCYVEPVAFAICIDTSCSVTSVLETMKEDAATFYERRIADNATRPGFKDATALHTFDGRGIFRAPGDPDDDTASSTDYVLLDGSIAATDFVQTVRDIDVGPPCLGSPIYEGMRRELQKLKDYSYPDPDARMVKGLITFADYRDTEGPSDKEALIEEAKLADVTLVYLGFGRVNVDGITNVQSKIEGTFIQGADSDVPKVLDETYKALAYTYCLTYDSPHPNIVNETATVEISITNTAGGVSEGSGKFPLPFVIAEDSEAVKMFIPLTEKDYERHMADGTPPTVDASLDLHARDNRKVVERGGLTDADSVALTGPDRTLALPLVATDWSDADPDLGPGFFVGADPGTMDAWNAFLRVPTDHVNLDPASNDVAIRDVNHYRLSLAFTDGAGDGKPYKGTPRFSIQDRTPPALYVKVAPRDGNLAYSLRLFEETPDQNPGLFPAGDRPSYAMALASGLGTKTAAAEYTWRRYPGPTAEEATQGGAGWYEPGASPGAELPSLDLPAVIQAAGMVLRERVEADLTVLARDNYAGLVESDDMEDRDAFEDPARTDGGAGPVHSVFDLNREGAQFDTMGPPFLPMVEHAELQDPTLQGTPGVAWWVESEIPGDPYDGKDFVTVLEFPADDEQVMEGLDADGVSYDLPLRRLMVRAQDGQRNPVVVEIPIEVQSTDFQLDTLQYRSRRAR